MKTEREICLEEKLRHAKNNKERVRLLIELHKERVEREEWERKVEKFLACQ